MVTVLTALKKIHLRWRVSGKSEQVKIYTLPLNCEGKDRESKVVVPLEENVCHETIFSSEPFVHTKQDSQSHANSEWCCDLNLVPFISSTSPVKSEEHERCAGHEEERANRVHCPEDLHDGLARSISWACWPVESKEAEGCCQMESSLQPVNSSPAIRIGVCKSTASKDTETKLEVSPCTSHIAQLRLTVHQENLQ